jgi:hypothetical protein
MARASLLCVALALAGCAIALRGIPVPDDVAKALEAHRAAEAKMGRVVRMGEPGTTFDRIDEDLAKEVHMTLSEFKLRLNIVNAL